MYYRFGGTDDYLDESHICPEFEPEYGLRCTRLQPSHRRNQIEQYGPLAAAVRQSGADADQEAAAEAQCAQDAEEGADAAQSREDSLQGVFQGCAGHIFKGKL